MTKCKSVAKRKISAPVTPTTAQRATLESGRHTANTEHISPEFLLLQAIGDLAMFQRWTVEEHLSKCGRCRDQLLRVASVIDGFRTEA